MKKVFVDNVTLLLDEYDISIRKLAEMSRVGVSDLIEFLLKQGELNEHLKSNIAKALNLPYEFLRNDPLSETNKRLCFFDYDRTLFAHNYDNEFSRMSDYEEQVKYLHKHKVDTFANDRPVPAIREYAYRKVAEGERLFCITHQVNNMRSDYYKESLAKYYAGLTFNYIEVSAAELKIPTIRAIAWFECVPLSRVTLVEDNSSAVHKACEAFIKGVHTSSICADWEANYEIN